MILIGYKKSFYFLSSVQLINIFLFDKYVSIKVNGISIINIVTIATAKSRFTKTYPY